MTSSFTFVFLFLQKMLVILCLKATANFNFVRKYCPICIFQIHKFLRDDVITAHDLSAFVDNTL